MRFLIAAGGTGGHIYPGIAIAQELLILDPENKILFIGTKFGLEKQILSIYKYDLKFITLFGLERGLSLKTFLSFLTLPLSIFQSIFIILSFRPQVVILTGGYVSLPIAVIAKILGIPILLHEENVLPGLTTRLISPWASKITVSFDGSVKHFKNRDNIYITGNPIRKEILMADRSTAIKKLGLDQNQKSILILGGSQGAKKINETVVRMLPNIKDPTFQIIHICGERDYAYLKSRVSSAPAYYHLVFYMHNIWDALVCADLIVSRAGATSLSEILYFGIPSILIPYPFAAEAHQEANAKVLEKAGAACVLPDNKLSPQHLLSIILMLLRNPEKLAKMREESKRLAKKNAAKAVVKLVYELL